MRVPDDLTHNQKVMLSRIADVVKEASVNEVSDLEILDVLKVVYESFGDCYLEARSERN